MTEQEDLIAGVILTIIGVIVIAVVIAILLGSIKGDFPNDAWWWYLILAIAVLIGVGGIYLWHRSRMAGVKLTEITINKK